MTSIFFAGVFARQPHRGSPGARDPPSNRDTDNWDRRFHGQIKRRNVFRMERSYKPNLIAINQRADRVAFDQENRDGTERIQRRSDFIEW